MELKKIILSWSNHLETQRNYSHNTVNSYLNDLNNLLKFIKVYLEEEPSLSTLELLDIRLLRSWLADRHHNAYSSPSNARAISSIKNFYGYLAKKFNVNCPALYLLKLPKKNYKLLKSLSKSELKYRLTK